MPEKRLPRTYRLRRSTVEWIDEFANENDADKREIVERAIRVYATKLSNEDWVDPKFRSKVDKEFERMR